MLDTKGLTNFLAGKDLAYIQSYANAHKNDPLVVATALHVANMKKQLQVAQQGQAGKQPTPTVVEQDIAAIAPHAHGASLPEDSGIAQLPAENMQHMAGGGIVAFEEGGHVPRYNGRTSDGSQVTVGSDIWDSTTGEWVSGDTEPGPVTKWLAEKVGWKKGLNIDPAGGLKPPSAKANEGSKKLNADRAAAMAKVNAENYTNPGMKDDPRLPQGYKLPSGITSDSVSLTPQKEKAISDTVQRGKAPNSAATVPATKTGLQALGDQTYSPLDAEKLGEQATRMSQKANADTAAAYSPFEKMLTEEKDALAKNRENSQAEAFLKAGLAMMAGTSPYAMANIGQGGQAGLASLQEARKEDALAKRALMGSQIALMQAQRAERQGNHRDAVQLIGEADKSRQFGITAALKAQELKQNAEYQRGMVGAANARINLMSEAYGLKDRQIMSNYVKQAQSNLAKQDALWGTYTPEVQNQKVQAAVRSMLLADPNYAHLASGIGFSSTPTNPALVRTLNKQDDE